MERDFGGWIMEQIQQKFGFRVLARDKAQVLTEHEIRQIAGAAGPFEQCKKTVQACWNQQTKGDVEIEFQC